MWTCVVNGGYNVEQTIVVEWPQFVGPHAGWWQLHGWFCVNDDDDGNQDLQEPMSRNVCTPDIESAKRGLLQQHQGVDYHENSEKYH
jgi:hypothetical protein